MILILGDGLLGSWIHFRFPKDTLLLNREHVDVTNEFEIDEALTYHLPDAVINCTGILKRSKGMTGYLMGDVNADAPHVLASVCDQLGVKLMHMSTDCVFKGDKGGYIETDIPDSTDNYGFYKAQGEIDREPHLTVRTSFVGYPDVKGHGLLDWLRHNTSPDIEGYRGVRWNGLTAWALAEYITELAHGRQSGIMHLTGQTVTKYDLLKTACVEYGWKKNIIPVDVPVADFTLASIRNDAPFLLGTRNLQESMAAMVRCEKAFYKFYDG